MTIQNQDSSVTHNGNGATTEWPFTFEIPDADSLKVGLFDIASSVLTEIPDTDFAVVGLGDPNGGEVTYPLVGLPITAAKRLVIWREVALTQDMDVTNQSPYYPEVLEDQLDRIVMMTQQLKEESDRSIKVTLGSTLSPDEFVESLQESAAEAEASAAAALVSETNAAASAVAAAGSETNAAASETAAGSSETAALVSETNAAASAAAALASENAAGVSETNAAASEVSAAASAVTANNVVTNSVVGAVRVDTVQSFTDPEKIQGLDNIGAISKDIDQSSGYSTPEKVTILKNVLQAWEQIGAEVVVSTPVAFVDFVGLSAFRRLWLCGVLSPSAGGTFPQIAMGAGSPDVSAGAYNRQYTGFVGAAVTTVNSAGVGINLTSAADGRPIAFDAFFEGFNTSSMATLCRTIAQAGSTTTNNDYKASGSHSVAQAEDMIRILYGGATNLGAGTRLTLMGMRG